MIIGLDVGGTHTDVVLLGQGGIQREIKVPTRHADLFSSILEGIDAVTEGIDLTAVKRIVLSTTLTTNAVIQGQVPEVGMVVCAGPGIDPALFRTNRHYVRVRGAMDHRGREIEAVDPQEIRTAAAEFKSAGIRHIGVVGKFSVRNPRHELQIHDILSTDFEKVFLGHRISGSLNFARRIATTYLNAAVYPIHRGFFEAVTQALAAKGMVLPLRLLKADGGNMRLESSLEFPAQTILSGPAASVMGAVAMAAGAEDALVMDIGGTTTDMAVLIGSAPLLDPLGITIGPHRTLIRSLETLSIGVGGDSTVRVENGRVTVGPDRSGPAIVYGGSLPTPTDALAVLGEIASDRRSAAAAGFQPLADALGVGMADLAATVMETACRAMVEAAMGLVAHINGKPVYTVHELLEGYRVQPRTLLVLGGPAPHFARHLEKLGTHRVRVVPRWQVANAIGAALARTTCEVALFADTQQRTAGAPGEGFSQAIPGDFSLEAAQARALELLRAKALERGANPDYLEMEVVESQVFNMVRGFNTAGKNMRVRVQVKPGLIHGYDALLAALAADATQRA
ncbi:MAG: hydantoinase/oxoprolinase family protein [Desulfobacterales bacterium]